MLLLKRKTFEVSTEGLLVTGEDAAALARADEVVAAALSEAEAIRESAKAAYEAERRRGYEDGLAAGRAEVLGQKFELVAESVEFMESVECKMADLVLNAIRKCLGEIDAEEIVRRLVSRAMQAIVRNQRQLTVRVAPEMVASVKARMQTILADFPSVAFVDVAEDPQMKGLACIVETEAGVVEASIDGQLAAIEKSIRKNFSSGR